MPAKKRSQQKRYVERKGKSKLGKPGAVAREFKPAPGRDTTRTKQMHPDKFMTMRQGQKQFNRPKGI